MNWRPGVMGALLLVSGGLAFAPPAAAQQAQDAAIVVSTVPGGESAATVPVLVRTEDTSGSVTVFVRTADGKPATGVVLYAAPPPGLSVTLARAGAGNPAAALVLDVPEGGSVDATITATWDDFGTATVPLLARNGATASVVSAVEVRRPGGPPLTVVGATDAGLALASQGATLASAVTVATGDRPAAAVVATVAPFLDATTGTRYAVKQPEVVLGNIPADATKLVPLDADLPYTGTFTSSLRLVHDGVADPPVALTVTRSLADAGVSVASVQTSSSSFEGNVGHVRVTRSMVLSEVAGREATLDRPVFVKATTTVNAKVSGDPRITVVGLRVVPGSAGCQSRNGAVTILAGRSCAVDVTLEVPGSPAQYDGTLRFTQPGTQPLETSLTLQVRRGLWTATFFISIGLLLGWLVNVFLRNRRSRLERLAKVARAGRELEARVAALSGGLADDTERRVYAQLRAQLAAVAGDIHGGGPDTGVDERLVVVALKVPVFVPWARLRRAILEAPEEVRRAVADELADITDQLAADGSTKAEAEALPGKVTALQASVRRQQVALMRNEINRVKSEVGEWLSADGRGPVDEQLDRALGFVAADDGSPEAAERELGIARGQIARAMRFRLEDLLDASEPPAGLDAARWAQLQGQVRATLAGATDPDGVAAIRAVTDADATLVRGLVDAAAAKVTALRTAIKPPLSPTDTERATAYDGILGHLEDARAALAQGDLAGAHAAYDQAREALRTARTSGFLAGAAQEVTVPALPKATPVMPTVGAVAVPEVAIVPLPADVARQWRWYEVLVAVVAVVTGVLVGLLALYDGNPTWGSVGDILLALLWGAGLAQATGALHQGFGGVRTALTS